MDTKDPLFEDKTQCFCFTEWLRHYPLHGSVRGPFACAFIFSLPEWDEAV